MPHGFQMRAYRRSFREVDQHSQIAGPYIASLEYLHRDLDGGTIFWEHRTVRKYEAHGTSMPKNELAGTTRCPFTQTLYAVPRRAANFLRSS